MLAKQLANFIYSLQEQERKTEALRQVLCEQILFEPYTTFRRIDQNRDGEISTHEIINFLQDNKISINSREASFLITQMDINQDDKVSYTDFIKYILPKEDQRLKQEATLRDSYYIEVNMLLPYEVEWGLARIFEQEVNNFNKLSILRENISSNIDFSYSKAFKLIDKDNIQRLNFKQIEEFMIENGFFLTKFEIMAFIRQGDKNEEQSISFEQFVDLLNNYRGYSMNQCSSKKQLKKSYQSPLKYATYLKHKNQDLLDSLNSTPPKLRDSKQVQFYDSLVESKLREVQLRESLSKESIRKSLERQALRRSLERQNIREQLLKSQQLNRSKAEIESQILLRSKDSTLAQSIRRSQESGPLRRSALERYENKNSLLTPQKGSRFNILDLVAALKEQIDLDRSIEDRKKQLSLRSDFTVLDAFRLFDSNTGLISQSKFERILTNLNILPPRDEVRLFFKHFDKDKDGFLRYSEFAKAVIPASQEYAFLLNNRKQPIDDRRSFSKETLKEFKQLLVAQFDAENQAESIRQQLDNRNFSSMEAFKLLDQSDYGYITQESFKNILNEYGIYASQIDLQQLIERYDQNQDGKISYKEFANEITPHSPIKY